jgi:hypothetical protein
MIKTLINSVFALYQMFSEKPSVIQILSRVMSDLPGWIRKAITFGGYDTREKFDEFLQGFDDFTGSDQGAIDVLKTLPADQEEKFFDHIKEAGRILGYNLLKVPGYYAGESDR